ncbi:MAG: squalene--hopene cyclase [Pirellula sp.]|nr:squalene--hopene cyclase [Pirellula sp.]
MIDRERLLQAYATARKALLDERVPAGHWVGELSSSALSTATACSALAVAARHAKPEARRCYAELIDAGLAWILQRQNSDGGWGDTDKSLSNISTTMLVRAAIHLAKSSKGSWVHERPASWPTASLQRAEQYIDAQGGVPGLRKRYGKDKTFAVPILTNCALAKLVPWSEVSPLPFEAACLPQSWYRFVRLPVVSYAIPALVAIGQAKYFHDKPRNPLARGVRALAVKPSLNVLEEMQPASGGFLEATPLTSFVVMSLASIGRHDHPVTQLGLKFLVDSARPDGSWPIDTNLATWVTTLAVNALGDLEPEVAQEVGLWIANCQQPTSIGIPDALQSLLWLRWGEITLGPRRWRHPFTGAGPGGWGWSNLSGAVPDADDTPGALLAMSRCRSTERTTAARKRAEKRDEPSAADELPSPRSKPLADYAAHGELLGVHWLLGLQNRDGGWATFCRGWGTLPFDRSGTDLTAHAIRALARVGVAAGRRARRWMDRCSARGFAYLSRTQRPDGSWLPLWFGNQHGDDDENPLYGTARVLLAYRDLGRMNDPEAQRGIAYLLSKQNADGGWGGAGFGLLTARHKAELHTSSTASESHPTPTSDPSPLSSVEETAVVVEALCACGDRAEVRKSLEHGAAWLIEGVDSGRFSEPSPIGFYFAKLWYYEKLYPLIFTVGALRAVAELSGTDA